MKKLFYLILIISNFIYASKGGGGGHPTEALFKTELVKLIKQIADFPEKAKKELSYDLNHIEAFASSSSFRAICAKGKELRTIKNQNKLAYVFDYKPEVIYLNCTKKYSKKWNALKQANQYNGEKAVFLIHEILRVTGYQDEDSYKDSSTTLKAIKIALKVKTNEVKNLLDQGHANCSAKLTSKTTVWETYQDSWEAGGGMVYSGSETTFNFKYLVDNKNIYSDTYKISFIRAFDEDKGLSLLWKELVDPSSKVFIMLSDFIANHCDSI